MKQKYHKFSTQKLKDKLQSNKVEMTKTYAAMGLAVMKNKNTQVRGSTGDPTNGMRKKLRKDTARILTILNQRRENE